MSRHRNPMADPFSVPTTHGNARKCASCSRYANGWCSVRACRVAPQQFACRFGSHDAMLAKQKAKRVVE